MSTDLALSNVSLYTADNANAGTYDSGNLLQRNGGNLLEYAQRSLVGGPYYHADPPYWWNPPWRPTTTIVVTSGHRVCACPKCAGDCCDCADCKVRRLEKRVAELEGKT